MQNVSFFHTEISKLSIFTHYISSTVLFIGLNILSSQKILPISICITVFFISEPSSIWGDFKIRDVYKNEYVCGRKFIIFVGSLETSAQICPVKGQN